MRLQDIEDQRATKRAGKDKNLKERSNNGYPIPLADGSGYKGYDADGIPTKVKTKQAPKGESGGKGKGGGKGGGKRKDGPSGSGGGGGDGKKAKGGSSAGFEGKKTGGFLNK